MRPDRFCRYVLRSLDMDGARVFYRKVFGPGFWDDPIDIEPLPPRAAARGVPGYWLGHVGVEDVVPPMYRFLEAGATRLDPPPADGRDTGGVVLRDPFGALLALTPATNAGVESRVAWHLLSGRDEERAMHAQWLYFFGARGFDTAIERVRELGGLVLPPSTTSDGHRVVACDDPQGAAFGIYETFR